MLFDAGVAQLFYCCHKSGQVDFVDLHIDRTVTKMESMWFVETERNMCCIPLHRKICMVMGHRNYYDSTDLNYEANISIAKKKIRKGMLTIGRRHDLGVVEGMMTAISLVHCIF